MPHVSRRFFLFVIVAILALGAALRIVPSNGFKGQGPDERFYEIFVNAAAEDGLFAYPQIFVDYLAHQTQPDSPLVLPPGRIAFIASAAIFRQLTGLDAMTSLRAVSAGASILLLGMAAAFLWRARGPEWAIGGTALLACSPLQIHLAQRSLIDGFFAFWAMMVLWTLWECLRNPTDRRWLTAYGISVVVLVLTKENAAFVMMGVGVLLLVNFWLHFGEARPSLWIVTAAAPLLAALILVIAAGGLETLIAAYRTNVEKSVVSPYAIATGDGPWFRYLVDLCLLNPALFLLALLGMGQLKMEDKLGGFLVVFMLVTFLIMGQLRYGMNARYTNIWEIGLHYFAVMGVLGLAEILPVASRRVAVVVAVVLLC
ncbi:MAG: phospholipid carrier-dependent glycosyltransferase, partial [Pirellulaceae bacterium]|nr:phospholipid carrier-dependent glycosyltransferase [Pirellulaceae bacterium]